MNGKKELDVSEENGANPLGRARFCFGPGKRLSATKNFKNHKIEGADSLNPIDEAVSVSSNANAQASLDAIRNLALAPQAL